MPTPDDSETGAVTVKTFQFQPSPLEVSAGAKVIWTNTDSIDHTVTSGTPEKRDERFTEGLLPEKGATATVTFSEAGTYPYFCDVHESMRGEVRVAP